MSSWAEKVAREVYDAHRKAEGRLGPWRTLTPQGRHLLTAIAEAAIERGREPEPESGSPQDGRSPGIDSR
jgi:hypothetical protein